jgi:predicted transporter
MKKINLLEWVFFPFISYGAYFIHVKWISLTCFIFLVTMLPVLFWSGRLEVSKKEVGLNLGASIFSAILFVIEALLVWAYMRYGPFAI